MKQEKHPLGVDEEYFVNRDVEDALSASPEERAQALEVLLETAYRLWVSRGLTDDQGLCRFPGLTQQRRRGLCRDWRDGGPGADSVSNDA